MALALPSDCCFSHLTAARLHGLPTPRLWDPQEPVHVMRRTGTPPVERRGVRSHRGAERRRLVMVEGVRVTHPADTWADLSAVLPLDDLVAMGDALLQAPHQLERVELHQAARSRRGPGAPRLRHATSLVRPGSASPWESKARVAFAQWGLPEPELNVDLYAGSGLWLARPDFVWRGKRVVGEYDGDQHRTDRTAWQYERERRARLEDEGWVYVELTSASLRHPTHRAALRSRLTRLLLA